MDSEIPSDTTLGTEPPTTETDSPFRRMLDALPVAAYTCDRNGLITYSNPAATALLGRAPKLNDPADRFGGSFELFQKDGTPIEPAESWTAHTIRTGEPSSGEEIQIGLPDGSRRTVLAHANPIRDEKDRIIGAVNLLMDCPEDNRDEHHAGLLAAVVESSEDAIIGKTLDGRILYWNPAAERLFGYSPSDAIGQPTSLIIPPSRREEERSVLSRVARGHRVLHYESERVTKQGHTIPVSLTASPIRDREGRVIGASTISRDITEQRKNRESLMNARDDVATQLADLHRLHAMSVRLTTTFEARPIMDDALSTAAAVEGTTLGLLSLSGPHEKLSVGATLGLDPQLIDAMEHVRRGGATGTCHRDRRRVVIEDIETDPVFPEYREAARSLGIRAVHSTPLVTHTGKIVGVLSTYFRTTHRPSDRATHFADLCARQTAECIENATLYGELREIDRSRNEFLAVLAHELRNPLAPIRNSARALHLGTAHFRDRQSALEVIDRQISHMTRLIDDLLDIARITGNKLELRRERIELAAVVGAAAETSRGWIEANDQQLVVSVPPLPIYLDADLTRLAQVVANLLHNASKFSHRGAQISLTATREGGDAFVSVKDDGIGVAKEQQDRIFDIFAQAESGLGRTHGGLGVGLTLAKRLIELHGGSIHVHSEGAGKGSEFVIRLPMAMGELARSMRPDRGGSSHPAPLRILVVDDNRDAADSLGMLMRMMGNDVRIVYDGQTALDAAREFKPAAILLDIGLPIVNGYEVAREIRRRPWGESMLLIATTGWSQPNDMERSREAGFDHHLVKPLDPATLMRLLQTPSRES
jgi:PAS domain S-box-containing protein